MFTYRDLIRTYSRNVAGALYDVDLTPRQRRLVNVLLNLASNAGQASVIYPPSDSTRDATVKHLGDILWEARPLVEAVLPRGSNDLDIAIERAIQSIRNI